MVNIEIATKSKIFVSNDMDTNRFEMILEDHAILEHCGRGYQVLQGQVGTVYDFDETVLEHDIMAVINEFATT